MLYYLNKFMLYVLFSLRPSLFSLSLSLSLFVIQFFYHFFYLVKIHTSVHSERVWASNMRKLVAYIQFSASSFNVCYCRQGFFFFVRIRIFPIFLQNTFLWNFWHWLAAWMFDSLAWANKENRKIDSLWLACWECEWWELSMIRLGVATHFLSKNWVWCIND